MGRRVVRGGPIPWCVIALVSRPDHLAHLTTGGARLLGELTKSLTQALSGSPHTLGEQARRVARRIEPRGLSPPRTAQRLESFLRAGAQQPQSQVFAAVRAAQPPLHAQKDLFGKPARAFWITHQAGQITHDHRLVACDQSRQRPIRASARLGDQAQLPLLLGIKPHPWWRRGVLPDHVSLPSSRACHLFARAPRLPYLRGAVSLERILPCKVGRRGRPVRNMSRHSDRRTHAHTATVTSVPSMRGTRSATSR